MPAWRLAPALLCAAAAGALQTLAFVHSAAWPLPLLAIALLAWQVSRATPRQAAALGWVFGSAWLGAATWWLYISLHHFGGLIAHQLGRVPRRGESADAGGLVFQVMLTRGGAVRWFKVARRPVPAPGGRA